MCIEHRVHRPKRLVDVKHVVQRTFSGNQDGFITIEGFINIAHNAARTVAGYFTATKPLVIFPITDSQNVRQQSISAFATQFCENRLCYLL
ncbi:MAG: hypothetical protein KBF14_05215 [Synergistaceae bacterium]|nr:hypothetical protein [Synergistaceae bacterium]